MLIKSSEYILRMKRRLIDVEKVTFTDYDPADYIETKEDVLAHLEAATDET